MALVSPSPIKEKLEHREMTDIKSHSKVTLRTWHYQAPHLQHTPYSVALSWLGLSEMNVAHGTINDDINMPAWGDSFPTRSAVTISSLPLLLWPWSQASPQMCDPVAEKTKRTRTQYCVIPLKFQDVSVSEARTCYPDKWGMVPFVIKIP